MKRIYAFIILSIILLLPTYGWSAGTPFTSVGSGNWNDGATWGNTSPGVKGTDWPGTAADIWTVAANHTVTYNVSETNELGAGSVAGILAFSTSIPTKLTMSLNDISITAVGEVRIGASTVAPVTKDVKAAVIWNTTSDNTKGWNLSNGGKLTIYGDPTYYGSSNHTTLAAEAVIPIATDPYTITVTGDYTNDGNPVAIAGLSAAAACVVTWTGHGLSTGDKVVIAGITQNSGDSNWTLLNGTKSITYVGANSFSVAVDTSGYTTPYDTGDPGTYARPKWKVGQELIAHKGGTFAHLTNDFCRLLITTVTANGANTDIETTVTERTAALTCVSGADVVNVSRNIKLYKLEGTAGSPNLTTALTNRPTMVNSNTAPDRINVQDAMFSGWKYGLRGSPGSTLGTNATNCVFRNCDTGISAPAASSLVNNIIFSCGTAGIGGAAYNVSQLSGYIFNNATGITANHSINSSGPLYIYGNTTGIYDTQRMNLKDCYIYSNSVGINFARQLTLINGSLGYNVAGTAYANANDFTFPVTANLSNTKTAAPPTVSTSNSLVNFGLVAIEGYGKVANAYYTLANFGSFEKVAADSGGASHAQNPSGASPAGGTGLIKALASSNCSAYSPLNLINLRYWGTASVPKNIRFYIQSSFATLTASEISMKVAYLDEAATSGHQLVVEGVGSGAGAGIDVRANIADWSQYIEKSVTPTQDGWITISLDLKGYESGRYIWVDPKF